MAPQAPPPLDIGDIAPRFTLPRHDGGEPFDSQADTVAGKPMILTIAPDAASAPVAELLACADDIALARELWSGTCGSGWQLRAARRALFPGAPQTDAWEIAHSALRTVGFGADRKGLENVTRKS